jgi:hypothetical protein
MAINENNSDNNGIVITLELLQAKVLLACLVRGGLLVFLVRGAVGVRGDGETWHGVAGVE